MFARTLDATALVEREQCKSVRQATHSSFFKRHGTIAGRSEQGASGEVRAAVFAMSSRSLGALVLVTVVLVAGSTMPASAAPNRAMAARPAVVHNVPGKHNPVGKLLGIVRSHSAAKSASRAFSASPLLYNGGPVQRSSAVYSIFWIPGSYSLPAGYANLVSQYFRDVAHDSYATSNVYSSDTQYYQVTGGVKRFASYSVSYKGAFVDTNPLPPDGCPNYLLSDGSMSRNCITDAQIETEIRSVVAAHRLPVGLSSEYFVFTPQGLASCGDASALAQGGCYAPFSFNGYCAYHSSTTPNASAVLYANMPYAGTPGCSPGQSNSDPIGAVVNTVSHEHNETITDPLGNGWFDSAGNENGDKCSNSFGTPVGTSGLGTFNQVINGRDYLLQQEWSNRSNTCVQRNVFPQPTASIAYTPARPVHAKNVKFTAVADDVDDTRFNYRWILPNGNISSLRSLTYKFSYAGTKRIVLIVTDSRGDQTKVVRTVAIA
jgi:hypothetical protein